MSPTASSVSALLRRNGLNPLGSGTPRSREGIRVTEGVAGIYATADVDSASAAEKLADEIEEVLRTAGLPVERTSPDRVAVR